MHAALTTGISGRYLERARCHAPCAWCSAPDLQVALAQRLAAGEVGRVAGRQQGVGRRVPAGCVDAVQDACRVGCRGSRRSRWRRALCPGCSRGTLAPAALAPLPSVPAQPPAPQGSGELSGGTLEGRFSLAGEVVGAQRPGQGPGQGRRSIRGSRAVGPTPTAAPTAILCSDLGLGQRALQEAGGACTGTGAASQSASKRHVSRACQQQAATRARSWG